MCEEYKSTYEDVVNSHAPECKCRPVEYPNLCWADNVQHQHLEEHMSSQCPLTYVECEFSDTGCDAKVYRKDLTSHLTDNLVTHMSLLAMENRKLKLQLRKQEEKADMVNRELKQQLQKQEEKTDAENRRLKQQLQVQEEKTDMLTRKLKKAEAELTKQSEDYKAERKLVRSALGPVPPLDISCPAKFVEF